MVFKVTKKIRKLAVFVLLAAVLVGMVPEREAKAEDYLTLYDALDKLNITYASSGDDFYPYLNYNFFLITNSYDSDGNFVRKNLYVCNTQIYGWGTVYNCVVFNSSMGSITSSARNYDITNGEVVFTKRTDCSDAVPLLYLNQTHEIVYANFDTAAVLSACPYFIDLSNDDFSEHTHIWIPQIEPASCTTAGRSWEECSCGETQNETELPALGHTWEAKEELGSCTVDSKTWEECSVCSATQNEVITPASGHVWVAKEEPATCTAAGRSWEECGCGETQNETELPALGHTWEAKEELGSCTVDSKTWEECSVCSATQNEVITPASGHVWMAKEEPATCTDAGRSWEECGCGETQNEIELPALGHTWEAKEELGSCTVDSKTWEECSVCSATQNEVITPASGHVWVAKEEPATCTDAGRSWEECGCGETQNETEVPALGHSWVAKFQAASCTIDGKTWEECSNCSAVQNETEIAATGHIYDNDEDSVCNICYYNRNIEKSAYWLDMVPIILTLFYVFPLNVVLGLNLILIGVVICRQLKKK